MHQEQFERDVKNLSAMVGTWDADQLFNQEYEALLAKVRAGTNQEAKAEQAQRMRNLLMLQSEFLMNAWLTAKHVSVNV